MENVRLFAELGARNRELTETVEQQTATGDILRALSRSPTELLPVLDEVARSAARFCGAIDVTIFQIDGAHLRVSAHHGPVSRVTQLVPIARETVNGRVLLERRAIHVIDVQAESVEFPWGRGNALDLGHRSVLSAPLLREGVAIGTISLRRPEVQPFTDKQIALLQTFADQAVIAIENVRLFTELDARNSELRVALEQQTATSELLKVIGRSTFGLEPVFETLAENGVRLCEAERAFVYRFDGQALRVVATHNVSPELREFVEQNPIAPGRHSASARAALEGRSVHIHDSQADPELTYGGNYVDPVRTVLAVPMLRTGKLLGAIFIYRLEVRPFTATQIALMETFADQAAIAIENARLLTELQDKNASLTESLEQQTATSEILRVISRSPTNVRPVFDAIAQNARRLCGAEFCAVIRFDGHLLHFVAHDGLTNEGADAARRTFPRPADHGSAAGRSILGAAVTQIPDVHADPHYALRALARAATYRSLTAVPMIRDGAPMGTIVLQRSQPGLLPARQIDLLTTFADQAVIAIENVRLFTELDERNRELRVALEQQTATSELLR